MSDYILLAASGVLLFVGIYLASRVRHRPIGKLLLLAFVCLYLLLTTLYLVSDYFTGQGFNESVLYHLYFGVQGAGYREYTNIIIASLLFLFLGIAGTYFLVFRLKHNHVSRRAITSTVGVYLLIILGVVLNPVCIYIVKDLFAVQRSDFYDYYRTPEITERPEAKRNVVFIYAEGLERSYFNASIFPGLIKKLRLLESNGTYFTDLSQPWGTGWTMGGMVASQCGLPLVTPSHGNSMFGMDRFLDDAICLGDLLADEGYQLSYIGGASMKFAGKGKFYATHGFTDIQGKGSLNRQLDDPDYMNNWGLHDDSLFDIAYGRFEQLSASNDNFGLFMLTLGTHPPSGSMPGSCNEIAYMDGSNPILNAVACSDYLIGQFVDKILKSKYAENTIIVIASDHLSQRNTAYDLLKSANRKNMLIIIDPTDKEAKEISQKGSILDVGPILLSTLGYKASIGLGRDIIHGETSLNDILKNVDASLKGWEKNILDFWNFPSLSAGLKINAIQEKVTINNRQFKIPILIEFNAQLDASLKFQSDSSDIHRKLIDHVRGLAMGDSFIWIDYCGTITSSKNTPGICAVLGKLGAKEITGYKIVDRADISLNDLRKITFLESNQENYITNRKRYLNIHTREPAFNALRVAHAGGGIYGKSYTNSYDALDLNIKKGYKYFEIDFSFTSDDKLVCIHDWDHSFKRSFGFDAIERPSLEAFRSFVNNKAEFKKCTLDGLADWMKNNPESVLITDVKENNLKALDMIARKMPDAKTRVIPQIYQPENYHTVSNMGFESIIWTLYKYRGGYNDVLAWVGRFHGSFAITMPEKLAITQLPAVLASRNISTYVHTVNNREKMERYINQYSVTEIYTDNLHPISGE